MPEEKFVFVHGTIVTGGVGIRESAGSSAGNLSLLVLVVQNGHRS